MVSDSLRSTIIRVRDRIRVSYDHSRNFFFHYKQPYDDFRERWDENRWLNELRRPLGEFYGTWVLVMVCCMSNIMYGLNPKIVQFQPCFAIGFTLSVLIYATFHLSGAHFNPVVSWAFYLRGVFPFRKMLIYVIAQFAGGICAAGMAYCVFGNVNEIGSTIPNHISYAEAFYFESVFTFIFVFTILNVASRAKVMGANAALAVGFALTVCLLCTFEVTGTSLNPARSLGPAVWVRGLPLHVLWIYFAGPFLGSTLAVGATVVMTFSNIGFDEENASKRARLCRATSSGVDIV